jgi:cell division protein FtsA
VLTGGGANLQGMTEIAEQIFDLPVRCGQPASTGALADHINNPTFASAVGLLEWAVRQRSQDQDPASHGTFGRLTDRIFNVFKEFFQG